MRGSSTEGQENLFTGSREEAAQELERLLKNSIREQMVADVPVGAFYRQALTAAPLCADAVTEQRKGEKLYHRYGRSRVTMRREAAREIAKILGTEHTELYITEEDAAKAVIPRLAFMFGEPFADSSQDPDLSGE